MVKDISEIRYPLRIIDGACNHVLATMYSVIVQDKPVERNIDLIPVLMTGLFVPTLDENLGII
jgi:hypothetical protein